MATSTTTVSGQQSIPAVIEPYFTDTGKYGLLPKAQEVFTKGYQEVLGAPLAGQNLLGSGRIAPLNETQQNLGSQIKGLTTPGQFGAATGYAGQASAGLGSLMNASALSTNSPLLNSYQLQGPEQFTMDTANRYMSPYSQSVTEVAKRKAIEDAQRTQLGGNLAAGRTGSLGSSGNILANAERERQLGMQLGDIQARGLESAYQNAQAQFERDRATGMGVNQQNLQAMLGVQQLGAQQSLQSQQANQSAALQAQAQRMAAAQGLGNLAGTMGQIGIGQQAADLDRLKTLGAFGDLERVEQQQQLDAKYQDALRQIGFGEDQLAKMANILRGVPLGNSTSTQQTTTPPPSFASQLAGMGLSGLSLYNMMGSK